MTKRARLREIIACCETRFNRGGMDTWKHGDFVELSGEMLRATGTNISPITLKRIFGKIAVEDDYIPQQATLDALKQYGRYVEAENVHPAEDFVTQTAPTTSTQPNEPDDSTNFPKRFKALPIILAVSAVIAVLLTWQLLKPTTMAGKIKLVRTEGQLPATAFFDLQLPETADSLFVNFGDKSPIVYVVPGEKKAAHIYYIPGVFTVSIVTRHQVIATTGAYIQSNGWIAFGCHRQDDIPAHFYAFPAVKTGMDSLFTVTNHQLFNMGLDTTGPILTRLSNYTPVAHHSDDFIFETAFKNILPEEGIYCRSTQFQISGSNGIIRFKLSSAGCSLRILNVLSEQTFKGATDNLSQFVLDLKQWNTVKLVNHDKQVLLYVNGKQIFTGAYKRSIGDIQGLFLEFEGTGVIKNCDLKSYDGKLLYDF